jgi:hypothetical protein
MLAVIAAAVVHYMQRTFACWVVVQVAKGHTHRAAQCFQLENMCLAYKERDTLQARYPRWSTVMLYVS